VAKELEEEVQPTWLTDPVYIFSIRTTCCYILLGD
jgi:hypothetical protein